MDGRVGREVMALIESRMFRAKKGRIFFSAALES
jgi:hypothetical protein